MLRFLLQAFPDTMTSISLKDMINHVHGIVKHSINQMYAYIHFNIFIL